jgi:uncharacterized protein YbjT (DUF2867 family)
MILVAGATGDLGSAVTRRLLDQGKPVKVLVRSPEKAAALQAAGAEVATGDLKMRTTLDAALDGIDTVITTANSARRGGADNPQSVDLEGNRNLIDAARTAGVSQFIFVSALGAKPDSPVPFLAAKGQTEAYLRASGMPFTIVSANAFMEVWTSTLVGAPARAGQPVTLVGEGKRRHSFISAADVAAFVVAAVGHPAAMNAQLVIGGPDALSLRQVVSVYERALGREVPIRSVRPGEPIPGVPQAVWGIAAGLDAYDSPVEMAETARTFGVRLTPLDEVVARELAAPARAH